MVVIAPKMGRQIKTIRTFLSLLSFSFFFPFIFLESYQPSPFAFFSPPSHWLIASPEKQNSDIKIGFIASKRKVFTPALSFAVEKIDHPLTYLKAVKSHHLKNRFHTLTDLGEFETKSGKAHLFQIEVKNNWGNIRILQSILIRDQKAYILTGSCLKKDFQEISQLFLQSFRSLTLAKDVFSSIGTENPLTIKISDLKKSFSKYLLSAKGCKEDLFETRFFQDNQWEPFLEAVKQYGQDLGICWQVLAIKEIKDHLINAKMR